MGADKKYAQILVILVISLGLQGMTLKSMQQTQQVMQQLIDANEILMNRTEHLMSQIHTAADSERLRNISFSAVEDSITAEQVPLIMEWTLLSRQTGSRIHLLYRILRDESSSEGEKWVWSEAEEVGLNRFSASMIVNPDHVYQYQVVEEGDLTMITEPFRLPEHVYRRPELGFGGGGTHSPFAGGWKFFEIVLSQIPASEIDLYQIKAVTGKGIYPDGSTQTLDAVREESGGGWVSWKMVLMPNEKMTMFQEVRAVIEYNDGVVVDQDITEDVMALYDKP